MRQKNVTEEEERRFYVAVASASSFPSAPSSSSLCVSINSIVRRDEFLYYAK